MRKTGRILATMTLVPALALATACREWNEPVGVIEKSDTIAGYEVELVRHRTSGEKILHIRENGKTIASFIDSDVDGELEGPLGVREYPWRNPREVAQSMYDLLQGNYETQ